MHVGHGCPGEDRRLLGTASIRVYMAARSLYEDVRRQAAQMGRTSGQSLAKCTALLLHPLDVLLEKIA